MMQQDTPLFSSSSASPLLRLGLQFPDRLSTRTWFVDLKNHQRPLAVLPLLVHSVGEETGTRSGILKSGYSFTLCFQVEGDMWRLEHWLEHSSATLSQLLRAGVPTSIEHLEEVIQDHREFLLQVTDCNPELMHRICACTESMEAACQKRYHFSTEI